MDVFSALAEPNRRSILVILARRGPLSASDIAKHFKISPPAISQHLSALRQTKLISMEKHAQQRIYQVNTDALLEVENWISQISYLSDKNFDSLVI